jgi:O-antigen/teichoic acid export membrane protein
MGTALATSVLLARGLGPGGFGQYSFVVSLLTMLALPFGPALKNLITREVAGYHQSEQWALFRGLLRRGYQWILVGAVGAAGVLVITGGLRGGWDPGNRWTLIAMGAFMLPFLGLMHLYSASLRGLGQVFVAQLPIMVARPGCHILVVGALVILGALTPAHALASLCVATLASALLAGALFRHHRPAMVKEANPEYRSQDWGKSLLPFTLLAATGSLNNELGILTLGWLSTDEEVAAFRVAQRGSMLVTLALTVINLVIAPQITRYYRNGDREQLRRLVHKSAGGALALALPVALPLIFAAGWIVELVFGQVYRQPATVALALLAGAQLVNVAIGSVGLLLSMSGFERDTLMGQVIGLIVNLLLAVVLIPPFGATGAALATATALVVWNLILALRVYKRLGFRASFL